MKAIAAVLDLPLQATIAALILIWMINLYITSIAADISAVAETISYILASGASVMAGYLTYLKIKEQKKQE